METSNNKGTPNPKESSLRNVSFDLIAVLALILSVIGTCNDCQNSKRDAEAQYQLNQVSFRPKLEVVKTEIVSVNRRIPIKDLVNIPVDSNGIATVETPIEVKLRIIIANVGESKADLDGIVYLDTTSGEQIFKTILQTPSYPIELKSIGSGYFGNEEIDPGDTLKTWHTFPIQFIEDSSFTVHMFMVYKNELDQVFDSYFRQRFITHDFIISPDSIGKTHAIEMKDVLEPYPNGSRNNSSSYNKEEGERLLKQMKQLDKR